MRKYLHTKVADYLALYIRPEDSVLEVGSLIDPDSGEARRQCTFRRRGEVESQDLGHDLHHARDIQPDYIVLNGNVHYEPDLQQLFEALTPLVGPSTRVVITFYSSLWKPLLRLATRLGLRVKTPEQNWIAVEDVQNLLHLSDYEIVRYDSKLLMPIYVPLLSELVNRIIAPLPLFRAMNLLNIAVARPVKPLAETDAAPSVSVVIPARNEAGNIEAAVLRTPAMGPNDELIFIEGNSTDNTWQTIQDVAARYSHSRRIVIDRQEGKGKGDAVRKGFSLASKEILMILDADLTTPPEELPRFYHALASGKGEFINGSRLVYPMEKQAMRFLNMLGNKFFAIMFSFVLGQRFKDTLCGTKVLRRDSYARLAAHRNVFGDFDPFGDFDLIFGAARMALRIVEVPVHYRERTYGETNIQRWKHGAILLRMLAFAARKIKFV